MTHDDLPSNVDAVVIGGGIAGVAAAAHLAGTGRRVVLLERSTLGAGASGRNSGVIQHPLDPALVGLHLETVDLYRRVAAAGDGSLGLPPEPVGLLSVTRDVDRARREAADLAAIAPHLQPTFLAPDDVRALEPALADDVAACRLAIGYPVEPIAATRAYAAHARTLGVEVREGVEATVWLDGDRTAGVRAADGRSIAAETVVVAAGPWSPALIDPSGTGRPIRPLWGVVVTVALDDPPRHVLEEAVSEIPDDDDAPSDGEGLSFSLVTAAGSSSLGSSFRDDEPDPGALVPALVARGRMFVPAVADAPLGPVRACARPLSRDGRPLVGRVPWIEGLWIVAGHGPWGISTGPASARLVADLIDGRLAAPPPAFDPARFGRP